MKFGSPFQYNRWETDEDHLIWLPPEFPEWEKKRCVFITGSRGSGKTTLLKGFEWYQRLYNKSLRNQLGSDPFEKSYIGVYLNMLDFITAHFVNWPTRKYDMNDIQWEEENARVFSLYMEYQILQLLTRAIQGLRGEQILKFSIRYEREAASRVLLERPEIRIWLPKNITDPRLGDLRLCFKRMNENIRACAIRGNDLQPENGYPTLQLGKMLEEVAGILLGLCSQRESDMNSNTEKISRKWTLKVCIDQAESPEHYQQKAINTMIARQETGDVSFAIASLEGRIDISGTYIPRHPLTDADRMHQSLDEIYEKSSRFHEFITAVSELRFGRFIGKNDIVVDLKNVLGEWDINALLYPKLKKSESEEVRNFIGVAKKNKGIRFFDLKRKELPLEQLELSEIKERKDNLAELSEFLPEGKEDEDRLDIFPFYQTYLAKKLNLKLPHEESEEYEIRAQKSREIRKKMVAAMLCLCREFNCKIPYGGYYMVISMSDSCIRDFLRQMHEIYLTENTTARNFVKRKISPLKQEKAIHNASNSRYAGISTTAPYHVLEVRNLIDSLGKITAEIQSAYFDQSSLKTVEKGRFSIKYSSMKEDDSRNLRDILSIAKDCHYIKIIGNIDNEKEILFRLHRLFAPHFGFSYRGAYSNVVLDGEDLLRLCTEKNESERQKIIDNVVSKIVRVSEAESLDKWLGDENDGVY
jgi:energy-coupling factor transporter ATP-binding protein EcfA2